MKNNICIGLDLDFNAPDYEYYNIIDQTYDLVKCFKINPAFFYLNTIKIKKIVNYLNKKDIDWIYDGKICDVLHTNNQYAKFLFEELNATGVTVNPFLGFNVLESFLQYENKKTFILCRTSNKGAELIQDKSYNEIFEFANKNKTGLVIAGNKEKHLKKAVDKCPKCEILSPGIGAQGGTIKIKNNNVTYNISRSIINSDFPREELKKFL